MACFVVTVVPDSVAVVICRSSATVVCCFVLDVLVIDADCRLINSSSDFRFWHTSTFQLVDMQAVVTDVVLPFSPSVVAFIFLAHRVQNPLIVEVSSHPCC